MQLRQLRITDLEVWNLYPEWCVLFIDASDKMAIVAARFYCYIYFMGIAFIFTQVVNEADNTIWCLQNASSQLRRKPKMIKQCKLLYRWDEVSRNFTTN